MDQKTFTLELPTLQFNQLIEESKENILNPLNTFTWYI
jgi:hypothetical protein